VELTESDDPPQSWFLDLLRGSALLNALGSGLARLRADLAERRAKRKPLHSVRLGPRTSPRFERFSGWLLIGLVAAVTLLGVVQAAGVLAGISSSTWGGVILDFFLTLARVTAALVIGVLWTVPAGVAIGLNPRLARVFQPVVQVVASIPATAIFPIIVVALLQVGGGLNVASVILMLLGTQWYVLFNVIAGATAIPTDLQQAARILKVRGWLWWRRVILPAIFPFLITGLLTATGGAWNASIVSEFVKYQDQQFSVRGLGAAITTAAAAGQYDVLLAATITMALGVALINRLLWKRLYRLAEERFRLE
jgi:NitT/TauT family transport system permease protein